MPGDPVLPGMSDRRDDDLRDMLDRLEDDLEALRVELEADEDRRRRPGRRRRSDRRSRPSPLPRPPSFGEFLRFTEEYTIPTVISMLEATIRSLELFREVLRLADPGRSSRSREEAGTVQTRLNDAGRFAANRASGQLTRRLDDLRTALSEANLPEESESRSLIEDIRDLSSEIEARIAESERDERERSERGRDGRADERAGRDDRRRSDDRRSDAADRDRSRGTDRDRSRGNGDGRGVRIDVFDDADDATDGQSEDGDSADEGPQVDIESELDSIKEEVRGARSDDAGEAVENDVDAGDASDDDDSAVGDADGASDAAADANDADDDAGDGEDGSDGDRTR